MQITICIHVNACLIYVLCFIIIASLSTMYDKTMIDIFVTEIETLLR